MLERCQTCKHWMTDKSDWEFERRGVGDCKAIPTHEELQNAAHKDHESWFGDDADARENSAIQSARAYTIDGSGYYSALRTRPDFGCVLHAPIKAEEEGK